MSVLLKTQIQLRNDTAAKWASVNPKLAKGEIGIEIDTRKFKIGDGTTHWNDLEYVNSGGSGGSGGSQYININNGITDDHVEAVINNPTLLVKFGAEVYFPSLFETLSDTEYISIDSVGNVMWLKIDWENKTTPTKDNGGMGSYKIPTVEASNTNGNIKINGVETTVYTLPTDVVQDADYVHTDNNYTDDEKGIVDKVKNLSGNEQVNKLEGVQVNGTDLTIDTNKKVNVQVPTKTSDITNDSGFINKDVDNLTNYVKNNKLGVANGVATLDEDSKINSSQLPDYLLGQVLFGGSVNASHTATLSSKAMSRLGITSDTITLLNQATDVPTESNYGYVTNEGIFYLASADIDFADMSFKVGDWLISTGVGWQKIDNTDAVTSVVGRTGAVTLAIGDIGGLSQELDGLHQNINNKVDKVENKGLSTNDFTNEYKKQLDELDAEKNVQSDWNETSTDSDAYIKNKPTKLSQFENDLNLPNDDTTYTFKGGTNSFTVTPSSGTAQTVTVTPSISNATESSDGLMSFSDKKKLGGIEDGANKTVVDAEMSETSTNPLQNKEITSIVNAIDAVISKNADDIVDIQIDLKDKIDKTDILILDCGDASGN